MLRILPIALAAGALLLGAQSRLISDPVDTSPATQEFARITRDLLNLRIDPSRSAQVEGFGLQRDVGLLQFEKGTMYLCSAVEGRTIAAVFVGNGTFRMRPSTDVERAQLRRFYGVEELNEPFTSVVLFFADQTESQLAARQKFGSGEPSVEAREALKKALPAFMDLDSKVVSPQLLRFLLNRESNELFVAAMQNRDASPLYFGIDPYDPEEIYLARRSEAWIGDKGIEAICQFHQQDDYIGELDREGVGRQVSISGYRMTIAIERDLDLSASAAIDMKRVVSSVRWFSLEMAPELRVDSVHWVESRGEFMQPAKSGTTWIRVPGDSLGAIATPTVYYHGDIIERYGDWVLMYRTNSWFPRHDFADRATFDLTFRYPEHFTLLASGVKKSEETAGDLKTARWVNDQPTRFASFNIGYFDPQVAAGGDTLPPVTLYRHESESRAQSDQIAWDIASSVQFFSRLFGRTPAREYHVSSYPAGHGEAYPGLIHLSSATFSSNRGTGSHESFRSHEVAHQWWGLGVEPASYHDWWLSEGFAEYCGLMYMHAVLKQQEKLFGTLKTSREEIMKLGQSLLRKNRDAAPLWLGPRIRTSTTEEDYWVIVYQKGAWALHMLRTLLLDPTTLDDRKFVALLKEFYSTYAGRSASTEDFQRIAERYAGMRLDWFFRQWVYGSALPQGEWAFHSERGSDGRWTVSVRVDMPGVAPDFRIHPLVLVTTQEGQKVIVRQQIQGSSARFEITVPSKPDHVEFAAMESVLGQFEEVDWQ